MTVVALGRDQYLYVNTGTKDGTGEGGGEVWTEAGLAADVTYNREKTEIDVTNRESARTGYTATAQGLKSFSIEYDTHKPALGETPNPADALLRDAWLTNSVEEIIISEGPASGTSVPCTFAEVNVGGGSESQPLNEAVTSNVKLTNVGPPIPGTFTAGAFTGN